VFAEQKSKKSVQEATDANVSDAVIEREFVCGAGNATGPAATGDRAAATSSR
jgi:hypothetical protein